MPDAVPAGCARRFRPERKLAEGGFGSVWYATQVELERPVALKILHADLVAEQVQVQRFLNEARVTAALRHPHVVTLIDHGVEEGVPWIAYEFVPGESLRARLARGPLPWREACEVALQVAAALEAAHAQGVLHRDIKPDNILAADPGHYKVADFGIAKVRTGDRLTARGEILGTPSYLSPVQIRGEAPGPDSDVYALGITLYELLTGAPPFVAETPLDTLTQHLTTPVPRVSARVPDVPPALDHLLLAMLEKERSARLGDATRVRAALAELLAGAAGAKATPAAPLPPRPDARPDRTQPLARAGAPASRPDRTAPLARPVPPAPDPPAIARRARGAAALAVALAAALAAAHVLAPRPAPPPRPSPAAPTPAPAPLEPIALTDFAVEPLGQAIRVATVRPRGTRFALELGRGEPPRWEPRGTIDTDGTFAVREIDGLDPDTVYRVRARPLDGPGPAPVQFVRTRTSLDRKGAPSVSALASLSNRLRSETLVELLPQMLAEPGVAALLAHELTSGQRLTEPLIRAIATYAWRAPSRALADALLAYRGEMPEHLRSDIVGLALRAGSPGAIEAAADLLARSSDPYALQVLYLALARVPDTKLFDQIVASLMRPTVQYSYAAARALITADPARARALFAQLVLAFNDNREKANLAAYGLAHLPDSRTRALLDELARSADPLVHAYVIQILAELPPDASARALAARLYRPPLQVTNMRWALVRLGVETPLPELRALLHHSSADERRYARRSLALLAPGALPPAELDDPEHGPATALSYATATDPALRAALRARAASDRDDGTALWALARGDRPAALPLVRAVLAAPTPTERALRRQAIAAWIAGDLLVADTRPLLERIVTTTSLPGFVRECAQASLAWITAGRRPFSYLIPPGVALVPTGLTVGPLDGLEVSALELLPPAERDALPDLTNFNRFINPTLAFGCVGPSYVEINRHVGPVTVRLGGELVLSRANGQDVGLGHLPDQNPLRVVIER